jgi:hypothetical protein
MVIKVYCKSFTRYGKCDKPPGECLFEHSKPSGAALSRGKEEEKRIEKSKAIQKGEKKQRFGIKEILEMKKLPCKYEAKGTCRYGDQCLYKHERRRPIRWGRRLLRLPGADIIGYGSDGGSDSADPGYGEMMEIGGDDEVKGDYTEFNSNVGQIYRDLVRIDPVRRAISGNRTVDIMFIIDCTGSMGSWIKACKKEILSIVDCVRN